MTHIDCKAVKHGELYDAQAMVKARGDGIAFDLRKADFRIQAVPSDCSNIPAVLFIDGVEQHRCAASITGSTAALQTHILHITFVYRFAPCVQASKHTFCMQSW